jgi:hypothetical protein
MMKAIFYILNGVNKKAECKGGMPGDNDGMMFLWSDFSAISYLRHHQETLAIPRWTHLPY